MVRGVDFVQSLLSHYQEQDDISPGSASIHVHSGDFIFFDFFDFVFSISASKLSFDVPYSSSSSSRLCLACVGQAASNGWLKPPTGTRKHCTIPSANTVSVSPIASRAIATPVLTTG